MDISYLLYFCFVGISILGLVLTGHLIAKKQGKNTPYTIPSPKSLHVIGIWVLFYFIAFIIELSGHIMGIWTWTNTSYIFLHAGAWWASILTASLFFLSSLNRILRYLIILGWVLLFEYLQAY